MHQLALVLWCAEYDRLRAEGCCHLGFAHLNLQVVQQMGDKTRLKGRWIFHNEG